MEFTIFQEGYKISLKKAAEELLRIAEDIEKDAAEVSQFVCDKCNHTATLATINAKRSEIAKEAGENVVVAEVTVNDKLHCPACEGFMAYQATEESKPYYAEETPKLTPEEEEAAKKSCKAVDYDSL